MTVIVRKIIPPSPFIATKRYAKKEVMKIFPSKLEKTYTLMILSACAGLAIGLISKIDMDAKEYVPVVATLAAAFFGAYFAFSLTEIKESKLLRIQEGNALRHAQFILARQHNAVLIIKHLLSQYENQLDMAFRMPGYLNPEYDELKQRFEDLTFMLNAKYPNLLMELSIIQERFEQSMRALRIRSEFYVTKLQPAIDKNNLHGRYLNQEEMESILGKEVFHGTLQGADELVKLNLDCLKTMPPVFEHLLKFSKGYLPEQSFLKLDGNA